MIWSIVYQQVENNIIQPRIQARAVQVHPFVVLVSVLFGSTLFGVLGALLAIPIAAAIEISIVEYSRLRRAENIAAVHVPPIPEKPEPADLSYWRCCVRPPLRDHSSVAPSRISPIAATAAPT